MYIFKNLRQDSRWSSSLRDTPPMARLSAASSSGHQASPGVHPGNRGGGGAACALPFRRLPGQHTASTLCSTSVPDGWDDPHHKDWLLGKHRGAHPVYFAPPFRGVTSLWFLPAPGCAAEPGSQLRLPFSFTPTPPYASNHTPGSQTFPGRAQSPRPTPGWPLHRD